MLQFEPQASHVECSWTTSAPSRSAQQPSTLNHDASTLNPHPSTLKPSTPNPPYPVSICLSPTVKPYGSILNPHIPRAPRFEPTAGSQGQAAVPGSHGMSPTIQEMS
eukprot:3938673-Rhodomonas_salina.1